MRRALLTRLPAFSHYFGIQPWQVDRMTLREISEYTRQLDEIQQEASHG